MQKNYKITINLQMMRIFKISKSFSSLKKVFLTSYVPIAKLFQSPMAYKYSTPKTNAPFEQFNEHRENAIKSLDIKISKIENQICRIIVYLSQNQQKFNHFLSHTALNVHLLISDMESIKKQIKQRKKQIIPSQQHQIKPSFDYFLSISQFIEDKFSDKSTNNIKQLLKIIQISIKLKNILVFFTRFTEPSQLIELTKIDSLQVVQLKGTQNIEEQYQGLQKMLHVTLALAKYYQQKFNFNNVIQKIKHYSNLLSQNKIVLSSLEVHYKQDLKLIKKALEVTDWTSIKPALQMMLPKITTNLMIYVPIHQQDQNQSDIFDIFKPNQNSIPVRILYHDILPHLKDNTSNKQIFKENIMFHIHGGGFIALSSHTTQLYTRIWANQSKMVLFSIDYRLAPQFPFPYGLQDCKKVYEFILRNIQKYFKIIPKNIYIGGDSAGGNLTCGLTAQILKKNWRVPNGLFLVYPFLDATAHFYSSRKYMINDPLLWPSLGKLALQCYIKLNDPENPLISPLYLTQGYINGVAQDKRFPIDWPVTYINVGEQDALRDQSLILIQKMKQQNIKSKCYIMSKLRHGYLCTDGIISPSREAVLHSAKALNELVAETTLQI